MIRANRDFPEISGSGVEVLTQMSAPRALAHNIVRMDSYTRFEVSGCAKAKYSFLPAS